MLDLMINGSSKCKFAVNSPRCLKSDATGLTSDTGIGVDGIRWISKNRIMNRLGSIPLIDDIELHFLELPKLDDHAAPMESGGLVNWLLFLKGADKSNWEVLTMNEPVLKKAMDTLEFLSQDAEARRLYEDRQKYLHDEASMIEGALAEGEARGEKRKAVQMALELLKLGVDTAIIAKASGLSEAEIIALKKQG